MTDHVEPEGGNSSTLATSDLMVTRTGGFNSFSFVDDGATHGEVLLDSGARMQFQDLEAVIPCFTPGTKIATPRGERPVEELRSGDRVITRDNGLQEIAWVGQIQMPGTVLKANPHLKPILIKAGLLGNGLPEKDMLVSPNHRVIVANDRTHLFFDESEVLVASKHLLGTAGVHEVDGIATTYIHFMFERHEVVLSNGAWTESFQTDDFSLKGVGNSQRNEIFELFPELEEKRGVAAYETARRSLREEEAQAMFQP